MDGLKLAALGAVILLSYTTQAMTGFGSTVIALTLGAHLFPIPQLIPVLVALNLPLCLVLVLRHREQVDRGLLAGAVLPWMGLGLAAGLAAAGALRGEALRRAFGLLVSAFAARELLGARPPSLAPAAFRLWLAASGLMHGVYASGGPMLTYALSRRPMSRSALRATLLAVWLVLNAAVLAACLWRGDWTAREARRALALLPLVPAGLVLGEVLHERVPEAAFRAAVRAVLLVSGVALMV